MDGVYMRWRMAKWVGQCAVIKIKGLGGQLHLQLCRSAATLIPGAHPTGAMLQALHPQVGPSPLVPLLGGPK